jgi:hypothetical protein
MKYYYQYIVGLPNNPEKAKYPKLAIRRIKHDKPLTKYEAKLAIFRKYVYDKCDTTINSALMTDSERAKLRKDALKYAGF